MKSPFSQATTPHYTTPPSALSDDDKPHISPQPPYKTSLLTIFLTATSLLTTLLCGFILGRLPSISQPPPTSTSNFNSNEVLQPPAGNHLETWIYNRTFSRAPGEETEKAWREIFPRGRGFIQHPTLAPSVSGIAVFHELHCLNGIRQAYYSALNKSTLYPDSESLFGHTDSNLDNLARQKHEHDKDDPAHIRHCFDYLRHALMCFSDTNLEPVNWELRGVTGWGFERKCRDYGAVKEFAERWRMRGEGVVG